MSRNNKDFEIPESASISPEEAIEFILTLQDSYKRHEIEHRLDIENDFIPENIIVMYTYFISHSNYQMIVENYKRQFIENESNVEPGVTEEERKGLGLIYDYISLYDFAKRMPNIFVEAIKIHNLLYSVCPFPEYGGKFRDSTATLAKLPYEVPDPEEAKRRFQEYLSKTLVIDPRNILDYVDEIIRIHVDLIKIQPFNDGNKRTFRALLNLLLGKIGIPPVYIQKEERETYKRVLNTAMQTGDYTEIIRFYYYKICDAIVDFDLLEHSKKTEEKKSGFVIK